MSVSVSFLICSWLSQWGGCAAPSQTVIPSLISSKTAGVSWGDVPARKACPLAKEEGLWESGLLYTPGTFLIRAPSQEGVWSLEVERQLICSLPSWGRLLSPCPAPGQGPQPSAARKSLAQHRSRVPVGKPHPRGERRATLQSLLLVSGNFFLRSRS